MSCTGGIITTDGLYTVHKFLLAHTGTNFGVPKAGNISIFVQAGGGSGSYSAGGGGGGGGGVADPSYAVTPGNYVITVGDGGAVPSSDGQ